ncbi:uncharacterized protein LOC117890046 [Drosophila subobscura]|uniref:uncharacterized protein LOC117890046 n=1 Tax=Drosophila subobscura TaxID=7241 RepID=UPI00155A5B12|nr:uncharacterized protein LOC117890046 [Drosophila subobscura]
MSVKNLFQLILMLYFITEITSKFEFTNIKYTCVDKEFCRVDYCYLKSINRTYKYMSVRLTLFKPIYNVKLNYAFYKRLSGYKPFLYNYTVDGCKFFKSRRRISVDNYVFGLLGTNHNLNHTCPYIGELYVDKLSISLVNNRLTAVLPFPEGDYLLQTHAFVDGIIRSVFQVYGTLSKSYY